MTKSQKFAELLKAAGVNVTGVKALGSYVHINTFAKYENQLKDIMSAAGFKFHSSRDGVHLDDYVGYRIVFVAA